MTEATAKPAAKAPKVSWVMFSAVAMGMAIAIAGAVPWVWLVRMNVRQQPQWPWGAATIVCWLLIMLIWLGGAGWPGGSSASRRYHLRLWRPLPGAWSGANLGTILGLIAAMLGLTVFWILVQSGRPPVDVSPYPSTALRFSVVFIGPLVSGVVEEAAFRGYMQSHLERIGPIFAILVTSAVFTLAHATHGLAFLLTVAPGYFLASVVYGYLALKSGSILPGMVLHAGGDAAEAFFVLLSGQSALLFAH